MFEVRFVFPIAGDKKKVMGLLGTVARDLPTVLRPRPGLTSFKAPQGASLTLEIFAEDAADAVREALGKLRLAFELRGRSVPEVFEVYLNPAEELVLEKR